jgi:vacuolar protein sorting-associated protein 11
VFDLENKFVAYTGTFTQGVRAVFSAWGNIFILGNDGSVSVVFTRNYSKRIPSAFQLSCIKEKPTREKLDTLYRKSLYLLALDLAKTQKLDQSSVADIYRQYGDHFYAKGDYDGAMHQYIHTIGHLQPSYVIRKVCGTATSL